MWRRVFKLSDTVGLGSGGGTVITLRDPERHKSAMDHQSIPHFVEIGRAPEFGVPVPLEISRTTRDITEEERNGWFTLPIITCSPTPAHYLGTLSFLGLDILEELTYLDRSHSI
ncbi:hypothetical protein ScPMuIL_018949 [Solemya velum]